ncbi:MAG: VanZ family protein [Fimbriimonadaceae bacterium]
MASRPESVATPSAGGEGTFWPSLVGFGLAALIGGFGWRIGLGPLALLAAGLLVLATVAWMLLPALRSARLLGWVSLLYGGFFGVSWLGGQIRGIVTQPEAAIAVGLTWAFALSAAGALLAILRRYATSPPDEALVRQILIVTALAAVMAYFSGSAGRPEPMEGWLANLIGADAAHAVNRIVRKGIHFAFYGCLGLGFWHLARLGAPDRSPRWWTGFGLGLALVHALADEGRQMWTPGRSGLWSDILLDMAGAAFFVWLAARKRV